MPGESSAFEKIFELCQDGVLLTRQDGAVLRANAAACRALGRSEEDLRRSGLDGLVADNPPLQDHPRRGGSGGAVRGEATLRRYDGSTFPAEIASGPIPVEGNGPLTYVIFRDVTHRRRAEDGQRRNIRALRLLTACNEVIVYAATEEALLSGVCAAMVQAGGYRLCWVGVCEDDARRTVRPVAHAGSDDGYLSTLDVVWADEPRGRGPTGTAARTGRPDVNREFETDPAMWPWRDEASRRGFRSSSALPLVHDGHRIGVITFYSAEPLAFDDEEVAILVRLADDVAYGVQALRVREVHARTHDALRQSETNFRSLIDAMSEGFALHDVVRDEAGAPRDVRHLFVNAAFERLLGVEAAQVEGRTVRELFPGVDPAWVERCGQVALTGEPARFQAQLGRPGRCFDVSAYPARPGQVAVVLFDVTDRRRAEEELATQRQLLADIIDGTPSLIFAFDREQRIMLANDAAARFLGTTKDSLRGRLPYDGLSPQLAASLPAVHAAVMATGAAQTAEVVVRLPGGERTVVATRYPLRDGAGHVYGTASVATDITEQKRIEAALRESEERLNEAQQNARIGSWRYLPGGPLLFSDEMYELLGLPRELPPTFEDVLAVLHPEDRDGRHEAFARAVASGALEFDTQFRVISRDGRVRTMDSRGKIRREADGGVLDAFGTVQDVTELKAAEAESRGAAARMEVLASASKAFAEVGLDDRAILDQLTRRVTESLADTCQVATLCEDGDRFELAAVHSRDPEVADIIRGLEGDRPWRAASAPPVQHVIRTGEPTLMPVITPEQLRASGSPERAPLYERFPPHSAVVVAMRAQGRPLGLLAMTRHRRESPPFSRDDVSLAQDLADRAALTIRGARLFEQARHEVTERTRAEEGLRASRQELRSLAGKLDALLEQERMRIARDLHDDMGQLLVAVKMDLRWVERRLAEFAPTEPVSALQDRIVMASSLVDQMVKTVQRIAADLRPAGLERIGLGAALTQEARRFQVRAGIACDVHLADGVPDLPQETATALYRIAQEALTNVARHACATRVAVSLAARDGTVLMRVDDDGAGMSTALRTGALGILGMRERALRLGGELRIEAGAPRGTSVIVQVPMTPRT
ncbi:MAG TPA: PAS domain S-box protein [Anaeromyxobacteraceae bacterium]|nr:PAS domain S-box protein [Anaeromyxobacteraceae bacterium]